MKVISILNVYIIKEIIPNYCVGVGFLSVILFISQLFQTIQMVVERNVEMAIVAKLLVLYIPIIFQFTLPIGVVLGVLLSVGRLSDDSEIIAMRACGVSLFAGVCTGDSFWFVS